MRRVLAVMVAALTASCGGSTPVTNETRAQDACVSALRERLGLDSHAQATHTLMIGRRDYGWLVRGLTVETVGGARNYECRLDQPQSGTPAVTAVRLCQAGKEPWGCPK